MEVVHDFYFEDRNLVFSLKEASLLLWRAEDDLLGFDTVSAPSWNADGFEVGGLNDWFLWQPFYYLNVSELEEA